MVERIRTERMLLRPLAAADRDEYLRIHELSRDHFAPWIPAPPLGQTMADRFQDELERSMAERAAGTAERWVGILHDGRLAGIFALSQIFRRDFLNAYAGWRVAVDCIGRGLATEGVRALLDLAFAPEPLGLALHRVQANVIPRNAPSRRVALKTGFRLEGEARAYLRIAGSWEDHLMFAKTADEHALSYLPG